VRIAFWHGQAYARRTVACNISRTLIKLCTSMVGSQLPCHFSLASDVLALLIYSLYLNG